MSCITLVVFIFTLQLYIHLGIDSLGKPEQNCTAYLNDFGKLILRSFLSANL